ncbi:MAG: glycosyltransferase family 4 protein [Pseudomonadota bacterium]
MNIWLVNQYAIPPTGQGGARHHNLALELSRRGHDVTILASPVSYITGRAAPGLDGIQDAGSGVRFRWIRSPDYRGNSIGRVWNMVVFAARLLRRKWTAELPAPDVILGSSPHLFAAYAAARLAERWQVPFVMEIRDLWPETLITVGRFSERHPLVQVFRRLERACYRRARAIVSLLPNAARYLADYGVDEAKVHWVPNGVRLAEYAAIAEPASSNERFCVMYAGTHGLANALDPIVDAAALLREPLPNVYFTFIGDGPAKAGLMARAAHLPNVEFRSSVPRNEVAEVLSEADAFVISLLDTPLYQYGISLNKLHEFLAAGRPVVLSGNAPGNPLELAPVGRITPPNDAKAIADAVAELARLPASERIAMGRRGRQYAMDHHDFAVLAARYEKALTDEH